MSSWFAPVANLKLYRRLKAARVLGSYNLLIATQVVQDLAAWREFWHGYYLGGNRRPFTIMDNGVIETGKPTDSTTLLKAAAAVDASCIVLPDVLGDAKKTLKAVLAAHHELERTQFPLMGVVQGMNMVDVWQLCDVYQELGVTYLSVPRVMVNILGSRQELTRSLWEAYEKPIHLLGFSYDLEDDIQSAVLPGVMGIDSAMPIWLGLQPMRGYLPKDPPRHYENRRPTDYWELDADDMYGDFDIVVANVTKVNQWLQRAAKDAPTVEEPQGAAEEPMLGLS